ncbi:DNA mismatch repair endonuclease MutL [Thermosyntropha sp.]|uniref:DNA mismatch repair endonuclease MutL n=1 Tax=Thermosyntropha sp. TaxID=2740820 RepID=UPI0025E37ECF|nr:DNA mismatch repair endonuclease MutL [Thermosyntropha sp.]MBO8158380.1 DNA mismatch repair endonuclease MutL [Thermosyntropha sp.]
MIKLLDDDLINKIAAGEVIERPASVVKELVENAIDAGAQNITVKVIGAGMEEIEVEDDGAGMSREEIPLAFMRHATSKIQTEDDLFNIVTMGFRGEALPSIASVSRVDVYSSTGNEAGVFAHFEGGKLVSIDYYPCPKGTRIVVKNIFYNTPARRKFLKSPISENAQIFDLMSKYALSHPYISFTYRSDKKVYFKTPGNGSLRDAVLAVYGSEFLTPLIDVKYNGENYNITGLISRPDVKRNNRKNQLFFVNRRPIRSNLLYRAVDTAYQGLLVSREYPVIILSITMPPEKVDVNVHPQKMEVRFQDEQEIFRLIYQVLREHLNKLEYEATWRFSVLPEKNDHIEYREEKANKEDIKTYISEKSEDSYFSDFWADKDDKKGVRKNNAVSHVTIDKSYDMGQDNKILGQVLKSYILIEKDDALYIVDQHAAHERIWFEKLKKMYAESSDISQNMVIPLSLQFSADKIEVLEQNLAFLNELGFVLDILGYNSVVLRSAPSFADGKEADIIEEILSFLEEGKNTVVLDKIIAVIACKKAVKAGEDLSFSEMQEIIDALWETSDYKNCPHGRPTMLKMKREDLDKLFKR